MSLSALTSAAANPNSSRETLQRTFQESVGGLIFGEMLKSMWSTVGEPAYIHGGQAEKMFRAELNRELSTQFASQNGGDMVRELFDRFAAGVKARQNPPEGMMAGAQTSPLAESVESLESARLLQQAEASQQVYPAGIPSEVMPPLFRK
jgi:Rod binding domain-containing protein